MPPDEFGAWGQWAGALGSFLAVVVALWVSVSDTRRRDRERRDQQAAQARTITAIATLHMYDGAEEFKYQLVIKVSNHGTLPITDLEVLKVTEGRWASSVWERGQQSDAPKTWKPIVTPVLGPGETYERGAVVTDQEFGARLIREAREDYQVTMRYVDAEGFRWWRSGTKTPERILPFRPLPMLRARPPRWRRSR